MTFLEMAGIALIPAINPALPQWSLWPMKRQSANQIHTDFNQLALHLPI